MRRNKYPIAVAMVVSLSLLCRVSLAQSNTSGVTVRSVLPTAADPALQTKFDEPNLVLIPQHVRYRDLVVFLPGTHGEPAEYEKLLESIAATGIRVVGLMYDDVPTSKRACAQKDDANCPGSFRRERVDGGVADAVMQNTVEESIHTRLTQLLEYENQQHPEEGWKTFLSGSQPNWRHIIISGHSQGAGMAAFIAKEHPVARVVLFSGGPDGYGYLSGVPRVAAWVREPSKTPMNLWWAEYHANEPAAKLLPHGYAALKIPASHIFVLSLDLPAGMHTKGPIAYHMTVVHDPRYLPQWKKMFGVETAD